MKFAYLNSCSSAAWVMGIAAAFRLRLVDLVWGVTSDFNWKYVFPDGSGVVYPSFVYNQEFWRALEMLPVDTNVQSSMAWAVNWTSWHCNNTYGLGNHTLFGASNDTPPNYVRWVEDGRPGQ
jgi:hypothetical protein